MREQSIQRNPIFPPVAEQPVNWGQGDRVYSAGRYKAIVNPDTGKLFCIVSSNYKLIRHEDAIEEIERALAPSTELGDFEVTTGFFNDGGRMRRTYRFPVVSFEIAEGDLVNPELHLFNSYDISWPLAVYLGAFRLVCTNGLVVGEDLLRLRKRHVYGLERLELEQEVSSALKRMRTQITQWQGWTNRQLSRESYQTIMETMEFGRRASEAIMDRIAEEATGRESDGFPRVSLWAFYNVLAWYITHQTVSLNHRVRMEQRLRLAMREMG
jgi:hypothetical protein